MFSRAPGTRQKSRRRRANRLRRSDPAVLFLLIALMGAAISGATMVASRSPHWPAPVVDCSLPAYKSERPPCADKLVLRPATPPFKGASAPPRAFELEYSWGSAVQGTPARFASEAKCRARATGPHGRSLCD